MGSITAGYNGRRIFSASSSLRALAINRLFLRFRASIWRKICRRPAAGLFRQRILTTEYFHPENFPDILTFAGTKRSAAASYPQPRFFSLRGTFKFWRTFP